MSATEQYESLRLEFQSSGEAICVDFRQLVPWMNPAERATHYLHSYPAKLLAHIPAFFLQNRRLSKPGDTVLDPFCGSGTVILESVLHGRNGIGVDANPLARLLTAVKVSEVLPDDVASAAEKVVTRANRLRQRNGAAPLPTLVNLSYWFYPHVLAQVSCLREAIDLQSSGEIRDFLRVCLSGTLRHVSLANPRLSVPVRLRKDHYPKGHAFNEPLNARLRRLRRQDVIGVFGDVAKENVHKLRLMQSIRVPGTVGSVEGADARTMSSIAAESIDLIITSPPYAGAQK